MRICAPISETINGNSSETTTGPGEEGLRDLSRSDFVSKSPRTENLGMSNLDVALIKQKCLVSAFKV